MIDSSDFPPTRKYLRQQLRRIRSHSRRTAQEKQDEVQASDVSIKSINQNLLSDFSVTKDTKYGDRFLKNIYIKSY